MIEVQIKMLTKHEHAGNVVNNGDVITVSTDVANWLISEGKAEKFVSAPKEKARNDEA